MKKIWLTSLVCTSALCIGAGFPTDSKENPVVPKISDKVKKSLQAGDYKPKDFSHLIGMKGFSKELLELHFGLYNGYVKNTNALNQRLKELEKAGKSRTPDYAGLKRMYGWEFDGMRLHEYYFGNLGGTGKLDKNSMLHQAIVKQFGSYEAWMQDFKATGLIKGVGWAILYQDPRTGKLTNAWINEHDVGHLAGAQPLLVMDVWEHAYITEYGTNRADYINAFFQNIDWEVVQKRFYGAPTAD